MKKDSIISEELKKCICLRVGKLDFSEVTDEDIEKITEMDIRAVTFNGELTDVEIEDLAIFPNLTSLMISHFFVGESDVRTLSKLSKLKVIQFSDCDFEEIESLMTPEYDILAFASCSGMEDLKMPKTRVLRMVGCEVDFLYINPKEIEKLYIQNSEIVNYSTLEYTPNLLEVNFDGSKVFDLDGNEVDEIKVSDATHLSFEEEFHLEDR